MKKNAAIAGQTIIEVLIAIMVVAMVMVTIAASLTLSVKNVAESKYRSLATSWGQEAMEVYRREKNVLGWQAFRDGVVSGIVCLNALPTSSENFISLPGGECEQSLTLSGAGFKRQALVTVLPDRVRIEITVSWQSSNLTKSVQLIQELREDQ